ncbi:hypothetical protein Nmel_010033 [Mimus melanotis]
MPTIWCTAAAKCLLCVNRRAECSSPPGTWIPIRASWGNYFF